GMELLKKTKSGYALNELSSAYLLKSSQLYLGDFVARQEYMMEIWKSLPDRVKSGKPAVEVNCQEKAEEFFPALAAGIFPLSYSMARAAAEDLEVARMDKPRILDVACGSCVWTIPMAEANKNAKVDALDFPAVLTVAKQFTERHKVAGQYQHLVGNW